MGASVASLAASGRRHHYQGAGPRQLPRPRQPPSPRHPWRPGHCAGPPQQPDAPGRPLLALAACRAHVCRGHGHQQPPSALTLTCCGCRSWTRFKSSGIWSLTVPLRASMLDGPQHHVISGGGSPPVVPARSFWTNVRRQLATTFVAQGLADITAMVFRTLSQFILRAGAGASPSGRCRRGVLSGLPADRPKELRSSVCLIC